MNFDICKNCLRGEVTLVAIWRCASNKYTMFMCGGDNADNAVRLHGKCFDMVETIDTAKLIELRDKHQIEFVVGKKHLVFKPTVLGDLKNNFAPNKVCGHCMEHMLYDWNEDKQ